MEYTWPELRMPVKQERDQTVARRQSSCNALLQTMKLLSVLAAAILDTHYSSGTDWQVCTASASHYEFLWIESRNWLSSLNFRPISLQNASAFKTACYLQTHLHIAVGVTGGIHGRSALNIKSRGCMTVIISYILQLSLSALRKPYLLTHYAQSRLLRCSEEVNPFSFTGNESFSFSSYSVIFLIEL
jgi:hypothetical protein